MNMKAMSSIVVQKADSNVGYLGLGDDIGQLQMDAEVQPGNSGGPIYDEI